jgi:hypothetical protein
MLIDPPETSVTAAVFPRAELGELIGRLVQAVGLLAAEVIKAATPCSRIAS